MKPQFLFLLVLSITFTINSNLLVTSQSSSSPETLRKKPDNETIYKISKQLCLGCIGESIEFLFEHNLVRAAKWELPLMWDFQLEKYARCGSEWRPADAVSAWAAEEKYYTYATNSCEVGQMCGHYTQIVWKTTRRIGCARSVCDDGDVFMTCNYDPPGNYVGERPY
ncbi:hypothetical protein GH714_015301 [Hevea brasiliensis]|uniref:SCP domain-containing protein n=1 Tax=Hevea brasiliensis TaxID=3981 RepID=A0A6A6MTI3_HEVBR|nr:hypothetical protein GH714_015301 [Hevea brasiliensis]